MSATDDGISCFKLKKWLFGKHLSKPPSKVTGVKVTPSTNSFKVDWKPGASTSPYNTDK